MEHRGDIFQSIINSAPVPVIWMSESVNEVDGMRRSDRRRNDSVEEEEKEEGWGWGVRDRWREGKAQQSGKGEEERGAGGRHHAGAKKV